MVPWSEAIDPVADQNEFAGVVSVHRGGQTEFARAYGLADRANEIPNTVRTRFAIASGTKGLTALAVVSLVSDGALAMSTTARSVLGPDLPLIGDDVTVEHLLAHRSGIGDYLDEEAGFDVTDYLLTVPPHDLAATEDYLAVLGGHPAKFPAGERFSYCNGGYAVLALIAERVSGVAAHPRPVPDERVPPARAGQRGRRDLLDGRRHQRPVAVAVRREDRAGPVGDRNGPPSQRRPGRVDAWCLGGSPAPGGTPGRLNPERAGVRPG